MSIEAIHSTAAIAKVTDISSGMSIDMPVNTQQAETFQQEAFEKLLQAPSQQRPEDALITQMQALGSNADNEMRKHLSTVSQSQHIDPVSLLQIQAEMTQTVLSVELGSKVAGDIKQSIDKITGMA